MRSDGWEAPVELGAWAPLAQELQQVDRAERAQRRIDEVRASVARARRYTRLVIALGWTVAAVVSTWLGTTIGGARGGLAAIGALGLIALTHRVIAWAAYRRGAVAWDWRAGRYRLVGKPADEVRTLDAYRDLARDALGQPRGQRR